MDSVQMLISIAGFIPELAIFILSIYYMGQSRNSDSKLIFIGTLIGLIVRVGYMVIPYISLQVSEDYSAMSQFYSMAGFVGLIGSILFCIGFGMMIQRLLGKRTGN
jgi:hypothetical protein